MGGVTRYITKTSFSNFKTSFPNSGGDDGIFAYCQYLIGASKFFIDCKNKYEFYLFLAVTMETNTGLL